MVKNDPLNFRLPSEEELGLKPLDLHIDPVPSLEELGIELDLNFDWRKDDKEINSPVDGIKP